MMLALNIYRPLSNNGGIVLYHDTEISNLICTSFIMILSLGKKTKSKGLVTGELSTVVGAEVTVTPFGNVRYVR